MLRISGSSDPNQLFCVDILNPLALLLSVFPAFRSLRNDDAELSGYPVNDATCGGPNSHWNARTSDSEWNKPSPTKYLYSKGRCYTLPEQLTALLCEWTIQNLIVASQRVVVFESSYDLSQHTCMLYVQSFDLINCLTDLGD